MQIGFMVLWSGCWLLAASLHGRALCFAFVSSLLQLRYIEAQRASGLKVSLASAHLLKTIKPESHKSIKPDSPTDHILPFTDTFETLETFNIKIVSDIKNVLTFGPEIQQT